MRDARATEFVVHEIEADAAGEPLSDRELWEALTRTFESPRYQPPMLPQVALDVMALSARRDVEVDQLVRLLEKDSLLAGRVLKLANSPLYGAATPIRSLKFAIVRMGVAELRDVVVEASMSCRVFKATGYSEAVERIRVHSGAVAHLARTITRFTSFEGEYAFLCGLLHDVGMSAALVALGDVPRGQKLRPVIDLWPALSALHENVGASVVGQWKLPPEVAMVVKAHHQLKVGEAVHPVAAIVLLAESIASENGYGLVPLPAKGAVRTKESALFGAHHIDEPAFTQVLAAKAALGFDTQQMQRVTAECIKVLEKLRA